MEMMGGFYSDDGEYIPGYILEKDEVDAILNSLIETGYERLSKGIKAYVQEHLPVPYEELRDEAPILTICPI